MLQHAFVMLRDGQRAEMQLIIFAVLQTVECVMRLPYMYGYTQGRAGYLQTLAFIITYTVLCIMYAIPFVMEGSRRRTNDKDRGMAPGGTDNDNDNANDPVA